MVRRKLPYKPKIFKQGLALVILPLSVSTCVLLFMNQLWYTAEAIALDEHEQSAIVEDLNQLLKQWAVLSSMQLGGKSDNSFKSEIEQRNLILWAAFWRLKNNPSAGTETRKRVARLEQLSHIEFEALASLPDPINGLNLEIAKQLPKKLALIYQLRGEVKQILRSEAAHLKEIQESQHKTLESMKSDAYGFIAGTFILAIVLVWLFSKSISSRMKILTINASALPRNQLPEVCLEGDDEIAFLDKVLNETAGKLVEAAEHRRSILGMVAHDMRSPLMSAQVNVQMIEEIGGDYSEGAYEALESAITQLSSVIQFVQKLLGVQKEASEQDDGIEAGEKAGLSGGPAGDLKQESGEYSVPEQNLSAASLLKTNQVMVMPDSTNGNLNFARVLLNLILRPKIFHKGLLVALGPLLLQISILLFTNHQLLISEKLMQAEQRCGNINITSNIIAMDMTRGGTVQGIYLLTLSSKAHDLALKIFKEVEKEYDKFAELVNADAEWRRFVELSKKTSQHAMKQIMETDPSASPEEKLRAFTAISEVKERSPEGFETRQLRKTLLANNLSQLHQMENQQIALSNSVGQFLYFGIAVNFLVAIGMLYFFSKNITGRLDVLVDNATRLGRREELRKTAAGTDEIAYLELILYQAKELLDQSSRQRVLMMASLAQQMRSPLQSAQLSLERFALLAESALKDSARKNITRSQSNIERVLDLINDLLTMETLETGKVMLEISECDVYAVAEDALATVSGLARKKNIALINSCVSSLIKADKAKLVQVLVNYLSNAIKFSGDNTNINVVSKLTSETVCVSVIDQGPGMDKETRDRVFEKFFQANTDQKKQGFGLGLAICQQIVESHGGRLGVESEIGKGSTFWFEIPLVQPAGKSDL